MIVVDTSVLVDLFRGTVGGSANRLREMERDGTPFEIPAICVQEVLQGARDEREWRSLDRVLSTQRIFLPEDPVRTHHAAARIYFDCRRRGVTPRSTIDCWIAAQVVERDAVLLHHDSDFERIASVCPLRMLGP